MIRDITITWTIEDVQQLAIDEIGCTVSDEIASDVLIAAQRHHDANLGINWGVLSHHLQCRLEAAS